jgi:hypothetical protein
MPIDHHTVAVTLPFVAKEKLNDFKNTTNTTTTEAIYEEFGFDLNIHESLIQKQYDKDGHLYHTWGNHWIIFLTTFFSQKQIAYEL